MSSEASAEPGQWRTSRAEYQRGMMDVFTDPTVTDVVIMSSAQVGKSEMLLNVIGYIATYDPGPILLLQPTLEMAEAFSKDRVAPMIRDTPILAEAFADIASRDSGNTLLHKQFPGGQLTLAGANSPASLASRPIRVVVADEIDKYPISAGTEGDPISLAEKRTNNFWNRKRVKVSTPTVKGASRIATAYEESDQRKFYVPCPHCAETQILVWANVKWPEGKPLEAAYYCPHCGAEWDEAQKAHAVSLGEWRGAAPFRGIAGFHINELYSPWRTLGQIAVEFLAAKDNPERLKTWVNTSLGEVWESSSDYVEPHALMQRAEDYRFGTAPPDALIITAGVDVQGDRLECYIWGFGPGEESWVLDFQVFWGDPSQEVVWGQLLGYLEEPIQHSRGAKVVPRVVAVDTGGLVTQRVYAVCRANKLRRLKYGLQQFMAVKGQQNARAAVGKPSPQDIDMKGEKIKKGIELFMVGVDIIKAQMFGRMKIEMPGPGYMHFSTDLKEDFYDQLTSERLITKYVRGFPRKEWHLPSGRRNEALDCAVYAYAGATLLGLPRFRERLWENLRRQMTDTGANSPEPEPARGMALADALPPPPPPPPPVPQAPRPAAPRPFMPPGKNWIKDW